MFGNEEGEGVVFPEEEWTLRQVAMGLYYAEQGFFQQPAGGAYTDDLVSTTWF